MTAAHAPVKFREEIYPVSADHAVESAHDACKAFFGAQPYRITVLEVRTSLTWAGTVVSYIGHVEAEATSDADTAEGATA